MRRQTFERLVAFGLMLGPLVYALTLEPEVVEVTHVIEAATPTPSFEPTVVPVEVAPEIPVAEPESEPQLPVAESEPEPGDRLPFAFVNEAGLVLSTEASRGWGKGRLRAHDGPGRYRAAKRADPQAIPEALWAQRGRTFDLFDAHGTVCTARLGTLSVLAQHNGPGLYDVFYPDDYAGEVQAVDYEEFENRKHSAKDIRKAAWSAVSEESLWLVAEVISEGDCDGALWARDHALPAPVVLHPSDEPSEVSERRLALHEASEQLAETKAGYLEWYGELGEDQEYYDSWEELATSMPARVRTWLDAEDRPTLVELDFGGDGDGEVCGDGYDAQITAFDRVTDEGFEDAEMNVGPLAIFDADLDGQYERLHNTTDNVWGTQLSSDTLASRWELDETWYCPC